VPKTTLLPKGQKYKKGLSIFQMAIKDTELFHFKTLQNLPKLWFENIPSGNPGLRTERKKFSEHDTFKFGAILNLRTLEIFKRKRDRTRLQLLFFLDGGFFPQ
jgi:hypothetical protein